MFSSLQKLTKQKENLFEMYATVRHWLPQNSWHFNCHFSCVRSAV